jgi:hypothetical protein
MRNLKIPLFSFFALFIFLNAAHADEAMLQALQESVKGLTSTVESLKSAVLTQNEIITRQTVRIEVLESGRVVSEEATQPERAPKLLGLSQGINPDIGLVGTVQTHLTENSEDAEGMDTIALKELELNVSQYVDPYSRLDAVIAFNDNLEAQNVDIEEAYYTHWGLPFGFLGQIGKFRSKIGKQNLMHLEQLPTVNYPLVIRNFFGDEGLSSSGARLQNMVPNPWDIPIELTGEVLRGNNGTSFSRVSRRPIFNTHLKSFFELTDDINLELGGTAMFGDENPPINNGTGALARPAEGQDRYGVHVYGADATLIWNLPENRVLKFQNEVYIQERSASVFANSDPVGFYSLLDFRFHPRFSAGVRFDYLEPLGVIDGHTPTTSISPYLTFWQSEFANFRVQYSHTDPADPGEKSDDAVFLAANIIIGSHKHPVQ